ncbi:MAG: substrate-binding domain-containing protein [Acidimicrobiales bacterium]
MSSVHRRLATTAAIAALGLCVLLSGESGAGAAGGSTALIEGSGSSWAANAVNQWVADVASEGIQVVYTPDGDAQGRQDFATRTSDFSVTSIGYQGVDPVTGVSDTSQGRPYAYLPIAAGGTSFPYQIRYDGKQVRNLRLSGETLAKIFTNQITNWDDPEITADNNGHALPSLPITPVVQSEGSGATAQLTRYFATEYPSIWKAYSGSDAMTEYFPREGNQIAQNGSNGAMNYVSSSVANGAIGYVEYSYPLSENYPVALMLNTAGYYTLPTQYNVAVALEKAQINMDKSSPDYLLQNLDNVYSDPDPRTYPLSSYVYMIEPTGVYPSPETKITTAKRQSLADFAYYAICQGQKEIGPIGYSPLPVNLVEAAFGQIQKLKTADPGIDLSGLNIETCDNPTFVLGHPNTNYLAEIAPIPLACDKLGAGPCGSTGSQTGGSTATSTITTTSTTTTTTTTTIPRSSTTTTTAPRSSGRGKTTTTTTTTTTVPKSSPSGRTTTTTTVPRSTSPGRTTTTTTVPKSAATGDTTTTTAPPDGGTTTTTTAPKSSVGVTTTTVAGNSGSNTGTTQPVSGGSSGSDLTVDPATGQVIPGSVSSADGDPPVVSAALAGYGGSDLARVLAPLAVLLLLLAFVLPAFVGYRLSRRRRGADK